MSVSIEEFVSLTVDSKISEINTSYPAKIVTYDNATGKASVEILTQFRHEGSGKIESIDTLNDVPVMIPRGANYIFLTPISKGDQGLLVFSKSSLNDFKRAKGVPTFGKENRLFSLSDGVFFPGLYGFNDQYPDSTPQNSAGLQVNDGVKISFGNGKEEFVNIMHQFLTALSTDTVLVSGVPTPLTGAATYSQLATDLAKLKA